MKNTNDDINIKIIYKKDSKYLNNLMDFLISFILENTYNTENMIDEHGETLWNGRCDN